MTELRKAAEQALKRLDMYFVEHGNDDDFAALQALRQALAQPKQEPVVGTKTWFEDGNVVTQNLYASDIYTAPPKREWFGLTDEEIYDYADKFLYQHGSNYGIRSFGKAIEAKLKEKNV